MKFDHSKAKEGKEEIERKRQTSISSNDTKKSPGAAESVVSGALASLKRRSRKIYVISSRLPPS